MSDSAERRLTRRNFLSAGLAVAGGVATFGVRPLVADDRQDMTRWALLSDLHIAGDPDDEFRGFHPYRNLQEASGQVAYSMPEGLIITGDLARLSGQSNAYDNVKRLLTPIAAQCPVHLTVGNHDHRRNFLHAFENRESNSHLVDDRYVVVTNIGPVRLIILDSLLFVNWFPGMLGKAQLAWLATYLRVCDDTPTILFIHHTVTSGTDLLDAGALLNIIKSVAKVKAVVFGHSHTCAFSEFAGIHLINLPAIGYNFEDDQPVGWVEAQLTRRGGAFTLRTIGGNRKPDGYTMRLQWRA